MCAPPSDHKGDGTFANTAKNAASASFGGPVLPAAEATLGLGTDIIRGVARAELEGALPVVALIEGSISPIVPIAVYEADTGRVILKVKALGAGAHRTSTNPPASGSSE